MVPVIRSPSIGVAMLVLVPAAFGCAGSRAPSYRTAPVIRGPLEALVSATGTLRPVEQVEVGSQVSGTVYRLHADYE